MFIYRFLNRFYCFSSCFSSGSSSSSLALSIVGSPVCESNPSKDALNRQTNPRVKKRTTPKIRA